MAPYSEWCIPETLLSLDVPSPQTNVSVRQVFHHWSDGADAARTVSCTAPLTLTAYFFSQYAVQLATEPSELVVLHNGVPQNTPAILWCDAGGTYHVTAAASQGNSTTRYMFLEWGSGGGFSLCLAPAQHLALYAVQHRIRVETEPTGFLVLFDGDPREAPFEVWCDAGALYELSAPLERGQDPRQYGFVGWSDAGSRERALECDGPRDLVASYALRPSALTTNALATVLLATAVAPVAVVLLLRPRKRRTRE
jgi:hypothetical protein